MAPNKRNHEDLVDIISKWSIEDILNEELFKDQVKEIPRTFVSLTHYFESFRYPFLEETRAELASCLNRIADAPRFDVSIEEEDDDFCIGLRWSSGGVTDERVYTPMRGDVILLSALMPKDVAELKNVGAFSCLAFVTDIGGCEERCFKVKLGDNKSVGCGTKRRELSLAAFFLLRDGSKSLIWNAMNVDVDDPSLNLNLIKRTLHRDGLVQNACPCFTQIEFSLDENLLQNLKTKELNKSQTTAICQVLSAIGCSHTFSVGRISGFPGTGKTEIIATVCSIALRMQCKVVVCAPNLFSVLEVVSRVLKIIGQNSFNSEFNELILSDIVILGENNSKKLNISGVSIVSLEELLVLVLPCFSVSKGWKQCMDLLLDILDNVFPKHAVFSECEEYDSRTENLKILKGKFSSAAFPLKDCIQLLLRYIPCSLFTDVEVQKLNSLINFIDYIWKFICCDHVELHHKELCTLRNDCCDLMRELMSTLGIPEIADKESVEHLCLKHARLIFCPVSDLIKLQSLGESCGLGLLIVDRACEVKECETLPLLQLDGLRHAILLGGNGYKPAFIISKNLLQIGYRRSLFGRLSILCHPECNLDTQYRMHPFISQFPNKKFFKQKLLDSPTTVDSGNEIPFLPECVSGAYKFLDVSDGRKMIDEQYQGSKNLMEAAVIWKIVLKLLSGLASFKNRLSIGVISPSAAQVHAIQSMLEDKVDLTCGFLFWVKSVDELESSEEDVIIISTVCSNGSSCLGKLMDNKIINFCLTRARKFLWIVGNGEMLKKSSSVWQEIVLDARERGCFIVTSRDKFLADTILNVKNEIKELDELLCQGGAHFNGTKWKVQISNDFKKSFVGIQSILTKQIIIAYLRRLACGWRPKRRRLYFSEFVKQFRVHGLTLVCTTDIIKEVQYIQVMKVWDVLSLVEIPNLLQRLDHMKSSFGIKYVNYYMIEKVEGDLVVPMSWEILPESFFHEEPFLHGFLGRNRMDSLVDDMSRGKYIEGLVLMRFYSLSYRNVNNLLTASDGHEIELPFEVSDVESEIISFPESAFILGRSGTGKTLVLMTKLVQREQLYFLAMQGPSTGNLQVPAGLNFCEEYDECAAPVENALSQIFLTLSPILCSAVKDYVTRLRRF